MNGKITYEQFYRIALVIDRTFIDDLVNLKQYYQSIEKYRIDEGKPFREYLDDDKCQSLYNSHLVSVSGYTENIYLKNEMGELLLQLLDES